MSKQDAQIRARLMAVVATIRPLPESIQPSKSFLAEARDWLLQLGQPTSLTAYRMQKADEPQDSSNDERIVA